MLLKNMKSFGFKFSNAYDAQATEIKKIHFVKIQNNLWFYIVHNKLKSYLEMK